ncbi:hypothetical protein ATANTOWER_023060 [Ataeniobius toweri]|uniref:Uncharacterized protein n=1 Tax=Ataeniobius toweri TaxID=208326 RepID=A0ABU7B895_9TELE|nr:hypothetical protein [Ataeniobius toweri]
MNKDSSLSLLRWTTQVGSLLNSSLLGSPFKNPVHLPPSTAPTSETPGPTYHPGTPLSTITCLTGKQPLGLSAKSVKNNMTICKQGGAGFLSTVSFFLALLY